MRSSTARMLRGWDGPAQELARSHREQRAVARPDLALAADDTGIRADRRRLCEQPRLQEARTMERAGDVDARRDIAVVDVQLAPRGPAECVDEDERSARVDPEVVEGRCRQEA